MIRIDLPPELTAYFEEGWRAAVPVPAPTTHVILPDHRSGLTAVAGFPLGADFLMSAGPKREARVVPMIAGGVYTGLAIRPGAARALGLNTTPEYQPVRLPAVAAGLARVAEDPNDTSLLFEALVQMTRHAQALDPVVITMVDAVEREPDAVRLPFAASGLSDRQLRRRFSSAVGLSPKVFAGTLRLRRAMIAGIVQSDINLATVATGHGYSDQPHFGRAVQTAFRAPPGATREALQRARRRFLGDVSETF